MQGVKKKTIVIASGGTGGHLYPTIAVADEIKKLEPEARIVFIGTGRIESKEVPRAGYEFFQIEIEAPKRSIGSLITFPITLATAIIKSLSLLRELRPSRILCGGAYLSVPTGLAGWALHIPVDVLEINAFVGAANKLLAKVADRVFLAYPESRSAFSENADVRVTGTPVRADLSAELSPALARAEFGLDPNKPTVLVFGGSLGSGLINRAVEALVDPLLAVGYNLIWQIGKNEDLEALRNKWPGRRGELAIETYLFEMDKAYAAADLVVCRAGASTLAELARLGKPSVLIPWAGAADNHQEKNARAFASAGAALVVTDKELTDAISLGTETKLSQLVLQTMREPERRKEMAAHASNRDSPFAAKIIAEELLKATAA